MPRRQRIDFPGAFFHITARGNRKQAIFLSDDDRYYFLSCLREAHEKYGIRVHAYCLMENHYHLFLELPRGGLSQAMHLINMRYSNYFNLKHDRCGHTFQSRYRSTLVEAAVYARELASYIHLNPVRAGMVERPEEYAWSDYRGYLGLSVRANWTSNSFILRLFGETPAEARKNYEGYVHSRRDCKLPNPVGSAGGIGILGNLEFVAQVKKLLASEHTAHEEGEVINRARLRYPSLETIQSEAQALFGPRNTTARKIAIYFAHTKTDLSLREIGDFFRIGKSGVTDLCRRLRRELIDNQTLVRALDEIDERLRR